MPVPDGDCAPRLPEIDNSRDTGDLNGECYDGAEPVGKFPVVVHSGKEWERRKYSLGTIKNFSQAHAVDGADHRGDSSGLRRILEFGCGPGNCPHWKVPREQAVHNG